MFATSLGTTRTSTHLMGAPMVLMITLLFMAVSATATEPYFEDFDTALQAAKERDQNLLIKFHETDCGWCDHIDTTILANEQARQFFADEMVLVKVYADTDTTLANRYSVTTSPTLVLIRPNGEEIDRITRYLPLDRFLSTLRSYERGVGTLDHLLQRAEGSTNRTLLMQIAEKYKFRGQLEESNRWYRKVVTGGDPTDEVAGEARIILADGKRRAGAWAAALADFEAIEQDFQGHRFAATAALWQAIMYQQRGDTTAAIAGFERYLADYPDAQDTDQAKEQLKKLTGAQAGKGGS